MTAHVQVVGLKEFQRSLKAIDRDLPKALRLALNDAGNIIVDQAVPRIPRRKGRAAKSVKARSTQKMVRVVGGGNRAPYYPWLDFGGSVGKRRSVKRPFLTKGRYIYDAFFRNRDEFVERLEGNLRDVARAAGIEMT